MNIQLPVLLWTVICFVVLMFILKNLLFKPVFQMLDQRKAKIAAAQKKKEDIYALHKEHEQRLALLEAYAKIQRENYIKSELKLIKIRSRCVFVNYLSVFLAWECWIFVSTFLSALN